MTYLNQIPIFLKDLFVKKDLSNALASAKEWQKKIYDDNGTTIEKLNSYLLLGNLHLVIARFQTGEKHLVQAKEYLEKIFSEEDFSKNHPGVVLLGIRLAISTHHAPDAIKLCEKFLENQDSPQLKIEFLLLLSMAQSQNNEYKNSWESILEAYELSKKHHVDQIIESDISIQMAHSCIKLQEFENVQKYSEKTLKIANQIGDPEKQLFALNNLAVALGARSDFRLALMNFYDALEIARRIDHETGIAQILTNLGTLQAKLFGYKKALNHYKTVLKNYGKSLDAVTKGIIYNNIGNIHFTNKKFGLAKPFFRKAFTYFEKENMGDMKALSLAQLSRNFHALGDQKQAIKYAKKANEIYRATGPAVGFEVHLNNLGKIKLSLGKYESAKKYAIQGYKYSKKQGDDLSILYSLNLLSEIFEKEHNFEQALRFHKRWTLKSSKYLNDQKNRRLLDLEVQFATKEKQREIEVLTRENQFQSLLIKQTDQINQQNYQLRLVNEELKQFAYVVSHDLKEPLRMIGSYAQLIHKKLFAHVNEETLPFFEFLSEGVQRMKNLLEALLDYATLGKDQAQKEKIDLNEILKISQSQLHLLISESGTLIISKTKLPEIEAHQALLIQLFQNLISNSIKFRRPDTIPEIHISYIENNGFYEFKFYDNGIGIEKEHREKVFNLFQRLHSRRQYDGTGIGLSICQKIIQGFGGQIWLEESPLGGACFVFTLPIGE
jgi:signal transduction histidine kinase